MDVHLLRLAAPAKMLKTMQKHTRSMQNSHAHMHAWIMQAQRTLSYNSCASLPLPRRPSTYASCTVRGASSSSTSSSLQSSSNSVSRPAWSQDKAASDVWVPHVVSAHAPSSLSQLTLAKWGKA